jgi:hypothetical protein
MELIPAVTVVASSALVGYQCLNSAEESSQNSSKKALVYMMKDPIIRLTVSGYPY